MPNFDIVKKSDVTATYRVARIMGDFDVKSDHTHEHFVGTIEMPDKWQIGVIWGGSGTGKTTIARELFGDDVIQNFEYTAKSVIDDMPKKATVDEIEKAFYAVGFGSVPSWLKPYSVLSNGEKMRVDLARAMLERDFFVFDEFTSVVDRNVAKTSCIAVSNAIRHSNKQFIAVTCHEDVVEWLQPVWVFCTDDMTSSFLYARALAASSPSESAGKKNGRSLGAITI